MLRRFIPSLDSIKHNRLLRWLGPRIHDPSLWHLNRRAFTRAVAIGAFCGLLVPVAQIPLAALLSLALRANLWIASVSTLVSNPFTYGPLYYFAYRLGARLIGAPALPDRSGADFIPPEGFVEWSAYVWQWVSGIGQPLLLGMLLMAVGGATLGYAFAQFGWRMKVVDKRRRQLRARQLRARADQAPLGSQS